MGLTRSRNVLRKALKFESLERREVFTLNFDPLIVGYPDGLPIDPLDGYSRSKMYFQSGPSTDYQTGYSQTEFDAKLKEVVGKYWEGVFGRQTSEITTIYPWINYLYSPMFGTANLSVVRDMPAPESVSGAAFTRSITNNQEAAIDEGDSSETTSDGFLYTVVGNCLYVVDLRVPELPVTKNLFKAVGWNGLQLFVVGDTLITVGAAPETPATVIVDSFQSTQQTAINVYDISDRMQPCLKSTTKVDGANLAARFADGQLTLVQANDTNLPRPELVTDAKGVQRYQSLDQYYAAKRDAILAALLPNYSQCTDPEMEAQSIDGGTWDDLTFANDSANRATSIWRFKLDDNALTLSDSETLAGLGVESVYQGRDAVYLTANGYIGSDGKGYIYKVAAGTGDQLTAVGVASVDGYISGGINLSEYNGALRVASDARYSVEVPVESLPWTPMTTLPVTDTVWKNSANITTIGDTADGWKVLGTLKDIGDGQGLLAASFIGDRAVITTGTPLRFDPLHGIDLADPAKPVELSDLPIPGFTTYLKQIDQTHWIGLGYEQEVATRTNHLQVSLYDVTDWAKPVVVDRWVSSDINGGVIWNPHAISYDPETGLLVSAGSQNMMFGFGYVMPVLKIDVNAADPLKELGRPAGIEAAVRGFTIDDVYVVVSPLNIKTFDVDDLSKPLGKTYIANDDRFQYLNESLAGGTSKIWDLDPGSQGEPFVITDLQSTGLIKIKMYNDQSLELSADESTGTTTQPFTITVRFESGEVRTLNGTVSVYATYQPVVGRASILYTLTDDAGNVLTDAAKGDEVWVTVSIQDDRVLGDGVFGGYVDVSFESHNLTVVGELEHRELTNGKDGTVSSDGIKGLGGFGGTALPGKRASEIGRFKVRIEDNEPIIMRFSPATGIAKETLLYNLGTAVDPANVAGAVWAPRTERFSVMLTAVNQKQDINGDGVITALDVLQVVNYINDQGSVAAESVSTRSVADASSTSVVSDYDISGDGFVTALDVLQIVNTINARYSPIANGEGPAANAAAVDQVFAVDFDSDQFFVNKSSVRTDKKIR